jgi:ABC-type multidrug transport system fused ATPase/permease subunit
MFHFSYGGSLVYDGSLSGGGFVAFCFVAAQVTMAAAAVPLLVAGTRRAAAAARRAVDLLQRQPRLPHRGGLTLQSVQGRVTWRGVSLRRSPHNLVADADIDAPAGSQPCRLFVALMTAIERAHCKSPHAAASSQVCSRPSWARLAAAASLSLS